MPPVDTRARVERLGVYLAAILAPAVCAAGLGRVPIVSAREVVPLLLLLILLLARAWGTRPAVAGSVTASVAYTYFFLPFSGTFADDFEHWVSFAGFTLAALLVGELAGDAERRRLETAQGRRHIEDLYQQLAVAFDRASEAEASRRHDQLKVTLLDALTHNLHTPLTSIKAAVTALIDRPAAEARRRLSPAARAELLQVIDEETDRLNRFVDGLSAADRPDPTESLRIRSVRLDPILDDALARARNVLRRHRVEVQVDPDVPTIAVDPAAVGELMHILLDNASKYTAPGTTIRVVATRDDDHHVRVSVDDEGPGIPDDLRERVFEKFYRIPGREAGDWWRSGLGLGLPIARRLAELQGGRIWIDTPRSGRGTRVSVTLSIGAATPPPDGVITQATA